MRFMTASLILVLGTAVATPSAEPAGKPAPPLSDWLRVVGLAPGSPLTVLIPDLPPEHRVMVWADQQQIIVLNATAVSDRGARTDLLDFAAHHPEDLISPRATIVAGRIRLAPDGVFVKGELIADVLEVVERVPRERVFEIRANVSHAAAGGGAAVAGAVGGLFLGALFGAAVQPPCHCDDPGMTGAVFGAPIGAIVGGFGAARLVTPKLEVIFRK